ncbi:MAG TPA: flippase-like domain-containing protein [Desulfobacteraceae bacterium]|nr:flippase-like domain-containing protein [Deltaproteobacteria bacterium]HDH86740.1 flippase-like domain-containing protein [Desulfobacteraceae bacterium]
MKWKFWLGLLISVAFLYIAFHNVDLSLLYLSIKSTNILFFIPIVLLTFSFYLIRALRWFHLLEPIKKIGLFSLFSSTVIGFAANCVLPARLGELIRANYIGSMENISKSSSLATIIIERLFDVFTILLMVLFVILFNDFPSEWESISKGLKTGGFFLLVLFIASIFLLIGLKKKTQIFLNIFGRFLFFLPHKIRNRIVDMLKGFSNGLVLVKGPSQLLAVIFYSLTLWCLSAFQVYILCFSMGLSLPFLAPFFILILLCLSVTLPSAPGYIGTFHLACQYGLIFYGSSKEKALSIAILLHAAGFIPIVTLGLLLLLLHHISLRNLNNE